MAQSQRTSSHHFGDVRANMEGGEGHVSKQSCCTVYDEVRACFSGNGARLTFEDVRQPLLSAMMHTGPPPDPTQARWEIVLG